MIQRFRVPLYGTRVLVCIGPEPLEEMAQLGLTDPDPDFNYAAFVQARTDHRGSWLVALRPDCSAGILAHEALHLTLDVARYHGLPWPLGPMDEEPLAYLMGALFEKLETCLKRYRNAQ